MAISKQVDFILGTVVSDTFLDYLQEINGPLAWNFALSMSGSSIVLVAGTNDLAATIVIDGKMRHMESTQSVSFVGQPADTYSIWVTTTNDDGTSTFSLVSTPGSSLPSAERYRKVGTVGWNGASFSDLTQIAAYNKHGYMHRVNFDPLPSGSVVGATLADDVIFRANQGSAAGPGYAFTGDLFSGLYRTASHVGVSHTGVAVALLGGTTTQFNTATLSVRDAGAVERVRVDSTGVVSAVNIGTTTLRAAAGSAATPALSFTGDTNTGLYSLTADELGISLGGVVRAEFHDVGVRYRWTSPGGALHLYSGSDAQYKGLLSTVGIAFGPGGGTSTDVAFTRTSAETMTLAGTLGVIKTTTLPGEWLTIIQDNAVGTADKYFIIMQSNVAGVDDTEFYVRTDGNVRADGTIVGGGADYAEWFEHDEGASLPVGTPVGINTSTGKVREYVAGDPWVGIVSEHPAFSAGDPTSMKDVGESPSHSLVGLVGQVPLIPDSGLTEGQAREVRTSDGRVVGWRLANGNIFLAAV